ncbi:MAG: hypothetical protein KAV44_03425 [Bacteroidales bacterium]|nr:hypothetical protein [Bacteroidales bacterium]
MDMIDKKYNRLILIGNGFDKALGLKTSYAEFILDYLKKSVKKDLEIQSKVNGLISLNIQGEFNPQFKEKYLLKIESITTSKDLVRYIESIGKISYKYVFFEDLINQYVNARWVDIEQYYYETLKREFQIYKNPHKVKNLTNIVELNKCMDELNVALNSFIKEQEIKITLDHIDSLSSLLDSIIEPLRPQNVSLVKRHKRLNAPSEVLFLNFNYTNTVQQIIHNSFVHGNNRHLFIHGTVNHEDNPIIFGYGDDTGEDYKELEFEGVNELLRKIKSFQYPRTHNYHNLLNYLELSEFDVLIIGHSCGLSDRTLLKTIFEHPYCLAIQNFHYKGESEDFEKRMEISRHFEDKVLMRERVLPYDNFASIPQY